MTRTNNPKVEAKRANRQNEQRKMGKQKQTWRERYPPAKPDQEPVLGQVIGRNLDYPSGHGNEEDKETGGGGGNDD